MVMVQECYSQQRLRDYLLGRLGEQESDQLETHLHQCPACEETAAHLEAEDTLAGQLRGISDAAVPLQDERFAASAERAKRMVPLGAGVPGSSALVEPSSGPIDAGEPLGGYELLERIGRGGMGAVYRGRHRRLDRIVAIKLLPSGFAKDPEAIARFQREMRAVGRLNHPAIIAATDAGEHDGTHYLVMELVDGLDLARIARALGPLPIPEACELIRQAALGLQHVHAQGVVHRDIKPSNLMLDRQGRVKILDLGLAQLGTWQQPVDEFTTVGQLMGTLDYMAPEQAESGQRSDYRSDLYSLGATLYRLLCGHAPYAVTPHLSPLEKLRLLAGTDAPKLATLRPDAPPQLCALVDQMLARSPAERPAGAAIVAQQLEPLSQTAATAPLVEQARERLNDQPTEQDEPHDDLMPARAAAEPAAGSGGGRRRWPAMVAAAAMLPLLALAGVFIVLETNKGQIVIESDTADVQVRLLRDGQAEEDLTVRQGANASRIRAGNYEVVIEQPSDTLVISDNTFTLRRGETIVTRITRRSGDERVAMQSDTQVGQPPAVSPGPTYEGKNLDQWLAVLERERAPDQVATALKAIDALADRQSGQQVAEVAMRATRQLPANLRFPSGHIIERHVFGLVNKVLEPQAVMRLLLEQLAIDDPDWQRRVLDYLDSLIDARKYPGSLDPLVQRISELAQNQQHPVTSFAALHELTTLAIHLHQRGKSVEHAIDALQRGLDARSAVGRTHFIAQRAVVDRSWPESLQQIFIRWSAEQLNDDDVPEKLLMHALLNLYINVPLATQMFPDLPQKIATQLRRRADPLPHPDQFMTLKGPFADAAFTAIMDALEELEIDVPTEQIRAEVGDALRGRNAELVSSPVTLLACLARHPRLQTGEADNVLRRIATQLTDPADPKPRLPSADNWRLAFIPRVPSHHMRRRLLPLYLISRGPGSDQAVEEAVAD